MGPFEQPVRRIEAIAELWDGEREGPDEPFTISSQVLAVEANTGIARVDVRYERDPPQRWLDIWIVRFDDAGLCIEFEEWPFAPPEQE